MSQPEELSGFVEMLDVDYHQRPELSKSMTDRLEKSPAHLQEYLNGEGMTSTDAMKFGAAYHAWVLEPDTFWDHYERKPVDLKKPTAAQLGAKKPSEKTVNQIEDWKKFTASIQGKTVIKEEDLEKIRNMHNALKAHPMASRLLFQKTRFTEIAMFWKDPLTNISCRAKADLIRTDDIMVDLKTTEDASPAGFSKSCAKYRYHVQAASYSEGYRQITGEYVKAFVFVAQEKTPPYAVATYTLSAEFLLEGEIQYNKNLATYTECMLKEKWPAYSDDIEELTLTGWAMLGD